MRQTRAGLSGTALHAGAVRPQSSPTVGAKGCWHCWRPRHTLPHLSNDTPVPWPVAGLRDPCYRRPLTPSWDFPAARAVLGQDGGTQRLFGPHSSPVLGRPQTSGGGRPNRHRAQALPSRSMGFSPLGIRQSKDARAGVAAQWQSRCLACTRPWVPSPAPRQKKKETKKTKRSVSDNVIKYV